MKAINQFIDGVDLKWIFVRDCEGTEQLRTWDIFDTFDTLEKSIEIRR